MAEKKEIGFIIIYERYDSWLMCKIVMAGVNDMQSMSNIYIYTHTVDIFC